MEKLNFCAMKFVTKRKSINPAWLGVTVPSNTPGFEHANALPVGFRFEVINPEHIERIKQGQFTVIDDGSPNSVAEIAAIDAEVAKNTAREKQDKRRINREQNQWTIDRRLVLYGILIAILSLIAFLIFR